jgi:hypothetical protein
MNIEQAIRKITSCKNQKKRTYVRAAERQSPTFAQLDDFPGAVLYYGTKIYSKTWSKQYAHLCLNGAVLRSDVAIRRLEKGV